MISEATRPFIRTSFLFDAYRVGDSVRTMLAKTKVLIGVVVIVTIIIIVSLARPAVSRYENMLSGMWIGDPGFLKKSGLSDMQLFISPADDRHRQGYLIMTDTNGGFIANQALSIGYSFPLTKSIRAIGNSFKSSGDAVTLTAHIDLDEGENIDQPLPADIKMTISLSDSSMTLFDDQKVYAYLYRDPVASRAADVAYNS